MLTYEHICANILDDTARSKIWVVLLNNGNFFVLSKHDRKNFKLMEEITMRQCVIWGAEGEYESILNQIQYEEFKGNLKCIALLSKTTYQFAKKKDGYPVISKEELRKTEFDYLIIAAGKSYQEIKAEILALGIPMSKIISSKVFKIPNFDFKRYSSLKENPVTILSDDCWGGYVYHALDLPFTSPLINIFWPRDSFYEFIKNPLFYLKQPLYVEREGDPRNNLCPIGRLGEHNHSVQLQFLHEPDFHTAEDHWIRRKKRINEDRIFVKFGFSATEPCREKYLAMFNQVPYPKVCTYSGQTNLQDVLYVKRFEWAWNHGALDLANYNDWFRKVSNFMKVVDILKLLNGEKGYIRES